MRSASGMALIVALVVMAVLGALSAAALRSASFEILMTANLGTSTQARLSAASAIEIATAAEELPEAGEVQLTRLLGPANLYAATITTRYLGETLQQPGDSGDSGDSPTDSLRHYQIIAEVRGPRSTHVVRQRYFSVPRRAPDPPE